MIRNQLRIKHSVVAALFLVTGTVFGTTAPAAQDCQAFTLTSNISLIFSPIPSGIAHAELVLEDGTVHNIVGDGVITELKSADGTIHLTLREIDDWGLLGTSIGLDKVVMVPTLVPGEFMVRIKTDLIGESGAVGNVFGMYHGQGTASFNTMTLLHSGKGRICDLP